MSTQAAHQFSLDKIEEIKSTCKFLDSLINISLFTYRRVNYNSKSRITLSNCEYFLNAYFREHYYEHDVYSSKSQYITFTLWEGCQANHKDCEIWSKCTHDLNLTKTLSIYFNQGDYYEVFTFSTCADPEYANGYFLNNFDIFERFIYFFKSIHHELIDDALKVAFKSNNSSIQQQDYYHLNKLTAEELKKNNASFKEATKFPCVYLSGRYEGVMLNMTEAFILYGFANKKKYQEIAKSLNLSPRTVEGYLQKIKVKLSVSSRKELAIALKEHNITRILKSILT